MQEKAQPKKTTPKKLQPVDASPPEQIQVDAGATLEKLEKASVKVMHGAQDKDFPVVGETIANVRKNIAEAFNVPVDALTFVNGEQVDEKYILKENDTLEFVKQAGVKGKNFSRLFVNFV